MPPHLIAVDNLIPADTAMVRSVIDDLARSTAEVIYIGTRQGSETELAEMLKRVGMEFEIAYVGKPGRRQVSALASIISPESPENIVDQTMEIIRREHLQRTPFNICLILVLLSQQGASSLVNASDTAVLEQYVQLLLGRNGHFLDPRWTLDPQNRETVLSDLAKLMVMETTGSLSREEVTHSFEVSFQEMDWDEDTWATLDAFAKMRILRVSNGVVSFQQTSYLHLFAAKAAISDSVFLEKLLDEYSKG